MTEQEQVERIKRIAEGRIEFIETMDSDIVIETAPRDVFERLRDQNAAWNKLISVESISPFVLVELCDAWLEKNGRKQ